MTEEVFEMVTVSNNAMMDLPSDLSDTKLIATMRGLYDQQSHLNNGRLAQLCIILAIKDLRKAKVEKLDQDSYGKLSNVNTRDFTPNQGGAGPVAFTVQNLWPDKSRDSGQLLREIQHLINHGAGLLRERRGGQLLNDLIDVLSASE